MLFLSPFLSRVIVEGATPHSIQYAVTDLFAALANFSTRTTIDRGVNFFVILTPNYLLTAGNSFVYDEAKLDKRKMSNHS